MTCVSLRPRHNAESTVCDWFRYRRTRLEYDRIPHTKIRSAHLGIKFRLKFALTQDEDQSMTGKWFMTNRSFWVGTLSRDSDRRSLPPARCQRCQATNRRRYLGRFTILHLHRPSGPARRLRRGISNRRRSGQAYHTGTRQQLGRFTCCFFSEETSTSAPSIQKGDASVFCFVGLQGRQSLVRSLQLLRGLIQCVLINYPAREEHSWDDVVTRISLSLTGK
jgi:hypothetical protein